MNPPIATENDPFESPVPAACAATRNWLNCELDGSSGPQPDLIREHREQCVDCKAYINASRVLLVGLSQLNTLKPKVGFADRVLAKDQADTVRPWLIQRRTVFGGFVLAASVLIAVFVVINQNPKTKHSLGLVAMAVPTPVEFPVAALPDKPAPLRDSFQEASSALSALTRKATDDGFGLKLPKWPVPKMQVDPKIEPALASLKEVGHNAELSLAPIADSTRRAFGVFWRELGPDADGRAAPN